MGAIWIRTAVIGGDLSMLCGSEIRQYAQRNSVVPIPVTWLLTLDFLWADSLPLQPPNRGGVLLQQITCIPYLAARLCTQYQGI